MIFVDEKDESCSLSCFQ